MNHSVNGLVDNPRHAGTSDGGAVAPRFATLTIITFVMAVACMSLELLLAQMATILYGGTVLRYSIVIGVFIASLGFGAAWWAWRPAPDLPAALWRLEFILGGLALAGPPVILWLEPSLRTLHHQAGFGGMLILAGAVGLAAGMELPVVIDMALGGPHAAARTNPASVMVGLDFLGTFAASALTPLVLYPWLGLLGTAGMVAAANAALAVVALRLAGSRSILAWIGTGGLLAGGMAVTAGSAALTEWLGGRIF